MKITFEYYVDRHSCWITSNNLDELDDLNNVFYFEYGLNYIFPDGTKYHIKQGYYNRKKLAKYCFEVISLSCIKQWKILEPGILSRTPKWFCKDTVIQSMDIDESDYTFKISIST